MKLFWNLLCVAPFIIFGCALMSIIGMSIKNEKIKKVLTTVGVGILCVYMIFIMGIVVPYMFLSSIYEDVADIMLMLSIIIFVWCMVSMSIYVRNKYIIGKNKIKEIYIRDIDVEYSPAVLSYLMNNKIEIKKDLSATILNLCAKNILKIQKSEDEKIDLIDLKNEKEVFKLKQDEKYAYRMLIEGVTISKINCWKDKIVKEYSKYKFSKEHKIPLGKYLIGAYGIIIIGLFIYSQITGKSEITGETAEIILKILVGTFFGAWEMLILASIKGIVSKNDRYEFSDKYTKKGAEEYNRWRKFERFMEEFSLINEKEHESIVTWGKYLSYSIALGINQKCDKELYDKIEKEYAFNINLKIFEDDQVENNV